MKYFYCILLLSFSIPVFSQFVEQTSTAHHSAIIYMQDGSQVPINSSSFGPSDTNRMLSYRIAGANKRYTLGYGKIDSVIGGNIYKFKKFKHKLYFVLAEEGGKTLACHAKVTFNNGEMSLYILFVFDQNGKEIDRFEFTQIQREGRAKQRGEIPAFLKKHFSNCPSLMAKVKELEDGTDQWNLRICAMCMDPEYFSCK